jgi:hypothetical protein
VFTKINVETKSAMSWEYGCYKSVNQVCHSPWLFAESWYAHKNIAQTNLWNFYTKGESVCHPDGRLYVDGDCAVAQAVSRLLLTAEAQARAQGSPCGIYGGQRGTGIGFSPSPSVFPCQYHSTLAPHSLLYHLGMDNGPVSGSSSRDIVSPHPNKPLRVFEDRALTCNSMRMEKTVWWVAL